MMPLGTVPPADGGELVLGGEPALFSFSEERYVGEFLIGRAWFLSWKKKEEKKRNGVDDAGVGAPVAMARERILI